MTFANYEIENYYTRCGQKSPKALAIGARISSSGGYTMKPLCPFCRNPVKTRPTKATEHVRQGWRRKK